jgi:DNA ligase-1
MGDLYRSLSANLPPPLTPPHKGEGNLACGSFPSPLWGGVRGGGIASPNFAMEA